MDRDYQFIDEVSLSELGTFDSREAAIDCVAALRSVNSDDFLDELTIANDDGPLLYGDSLRDALRNRDAARAQVEAGGGSDGGRSYGSGDSGHGDGVLAAKSHK